MQDCILDAGLLALVFSATSSVFTEPGLPNSLTAAAGWLLSRARPATTALIVAAQAPTPRTSIHVLVTNVVVSQMNGMQLAQTKEH